MVFVIFLAQCAILMTVALLWAKWSELDLAFSAPAFRKSEPWILLFILWCTALWALSSFLPIEVDPGSGERMDQLSLGEDLVVSVVLGPLSEELVFRGAMFASLLRRWGIWAAVLVPSLIWGLLHVQYEWWLVAAISGMGALLAMTRWRSGSLYVPVGLHAAWNFLVTLDDHGLLRFMA